MSFVVVTGAGATARATANQFADSGERVRQLTRSGAGVNHPLVERLATDVTDADRLTELTKGARVLVNCAIPAYDRWATEVPPMATALLTAVERTGAGYVMLGNTYGYGHVAGPITEDLPMAATTVKGTVRARMWLDALAADEAGRARVTEVRAGAFLGAGAISGYTLFVPGPVLAGEVAGYPGDLDVAHSWAYTEDVARTLVAASRDDRAWGRAWHAPVTSTLSVRALTTRLAELAGVPEPTLTRIHAGQLTAMAAETPLFAELLEMLYSTEHPHLLDATYTEAMLGVHPTPLDTVLRETVDALRTVEAAG
ncbi:NAD-dependent epimerase/dehydratase family protein [Actinoplanes regularis]|uniref:Nucleoside-diphosphate-sugar epimerase n=1 Tax=Actinoplanes regularis TaxID=52697 RepID=A0A239JH52_9ACTN|nr:NAD-dependent epimerase/dehydratase family protein [Actinoplanes regularis]GIE92023.1 NAD-dependent epimerase [Actinoplanes regularis]SNT05241.1 Nucleoside-diphosphate-sugar epimerase [Actinoplanes regularis]